MFDGARHASFRVEDRKRRDDRAFLEKLKTASLDELRVIHKNHRHKDAPMWKKIAIARAIVRVP